MAILLGALRKSIKKLKIISKLMDFLNQTIGKYKLTRIIGEGGMASVYEGTHLFLGTKAAVKVLSPMLSKNDQFRQRFRNEAAFMASLDHPNISKVLDFEDSDEVLAIVMELLAGSDLNDLVKDKGALTFDELKPLFVQILDAFKYAHEKGIIHRDIKPSNIYILPNGQVKILDFGIAKLFGQGNEMTQTGTQMGTPAYMSPEQVKGDKSIDHRSDIYSLGVTLFYAIEGRPPYDTENESQFDIFNKIVYEELQVLSSNSESAELIQKACQKNRELRYQSCEEWSVALNGDEKQPRKVVTDKTKVENFVHEKIKLESKTGRKVEVQEETSDNSQKITNSNQNIERKTKHKIRLLIFFILFFGSGIGAYIYFMSSKSINEVKIGKQTWMAENLNVDKFRNGDPIQDAKTAEEWLKAGENGEPAWCYYNNDPANGQKYGKLYNWYAVNDKRGLAPNGYHIPSYAEWTSLLTFIGAEWGKKMKSKNGWEKNGNGWDSIGFSGFPGGFRENDDGLFYGIGNCGFWWSSTEDEDDTDESYILSLEEGDDVWRYSLNKTSGFSVRCLRD